MPSRPSARLERRLLQGTVTVTALIPIWVGVAGIVAGLGAFDASGIDASGGASRNADSHVRYLSGLSLAIGVAFWSTVPAIEASGSRFRLLTGLVVVGGLARLYAAVLTGLPGPAMRVGLALELLAAPLLALWRERLERRFSKDG
jgi:hypothetical protein